jgi:hypothetical protein
MLLATATPKRQPPRPAVRKLRDPNMLPSVTEEVEG